jgi:L-fuconolactonase
MIDAHQHFWRLGQNDCAWPTPDLAAIHRDYGPADLTRLAAPAGVTGSVLVQSQPSDRDTDWLLALAAGEPFVKAVVGWADLAHPRAAERIAALAMHPKLKGLRPMLQDLPQDDWICGPAPAAGLEAMTGHGLVFDALVRPRHVPHLEILARRHPDLRVVIDHAAKPPLADGGLDAWRHDIGAIAALPNVFCKLSGLLTEASPGAGEATLKPCVDHLLKVFGPQRLMWGSDWPVLELAGGYAGWLALARTLTHPAGDAAQTAIFETTTSRVYGM